MKSIFYKPIIDVKATGKQIRQLRIVAGISPKELQNIFSFPNPQTVYNWELGKNLPSIDNLLILAKLFGVSVEDIIKTNLVEVDADNFPCRLQKSA